MKIIDLLNKIAKGEEVPKKIKYRNDTYIVFEDACCKEVKYRNVERDENGYIQYLFQEWIIDAILNDEIEIIEEVEDKEYEDIDFLGTNFTYGDCTDELTTIDWQISVISNKINALIRNQKKILERLDNDK